VTGEPQTGPRGLTPGMAYAAFVILFPFFVMAMFGSDRAAEICSTVMPGTDETAKFWYGIPCAAEFQAEGKYVSAFIGAFVITGMYATMAFPISTFVVGAIVERLAPNRSRMAEWIVTIALFIFPAVVLLIAFR
jgi:hypothetical protein